MIDEKDARMIAEKYRLHSLGTIGILIWAKKCGKLNNLKLELNQLISKGDFRISSEVYKLALKKVGESFK